MAGPGATVGRQGGSSANEKGKKTGVEDENSPLRAQRDPKHGSSGTWVSKSHSVPDSEGVSTGCNKRA